MGKTEIDPEPEDISFEEALANLEEIVHRMESGDAPLDSLVQNYEKGVKLLKICRDKIEGAEMKIKEAQTSSDKYVEKDFEDVVEGVKILTF